MKLQQTLKFIEQVLSTYRNPVVMWSGGKDSMVMLHLIHTHFKKLPVVFYRDPYFPQKNKFADSIIALWNLEVFDYPPLQMALQSVNDHLEMVSCYQFSPTTHFRIPKNLLPLEEGKPFECGVRMMGRPTGTFNYPWDVVFVGHKSCDVDPNWGPIPLTTDIQKNAHAPHLAFPLKDWSHDEVWAYTADQHLPVHEKRYTKVDATHWKESTDKTENPDYVPICVKCMDWREKHKVFCPLVKQEIPNMSSQTRYLLPMEHPWFTTSGEV